MTVDALHTRLAAALSHHQAGRLSMARSVYSAILENHPRCFDALHLLGILEADQGDLERGITLMRRAVAVDGSRSQAHYSLATTFLKRGDLSAALSSLESALALQPHFAEAWFVRGNVYQQTDRLEESVASYRQAIEARPAFAESYNALAAAERALRRIDAALHSVNRALALQPRYAKALNNRGLIQLDTGRAAAAVEDFRGAIALDPAFPEAWHNLGTALMQLRRFAEARDAFVRLAAVAPTFRHVKGNLLFAKLSCCDWAGFDAAADELRDAVAACEHAALPATFLSVCDSPALQLRCAELYTDAYFPGCAPLVDAPRAMPRPHKIAVAYLSGDFGEHAVTYLLAGVFERHDSTRFETVALSWDRRDTGPTRRRLESAFSRFIDVTDSKDETVAQLMRDLGIDIAVDLMGHTLGQRTGILARRPAPIQVNFLGLPASMGARYIDYLIADRYVVPEGQTTQYAERLVRLPSCFQPNDDVRAAPPSGGSRSDYGLPPDVPVFCCFNRNSKVTPIIFEAWMRILREDSAIVLWLLAVDSATVDHLRHEAAHRGVEDRRLVFAGEVPYESYLARYAHADLFLDTVPFNGGATVSDAVFMGLPVLTCTGESFASRMAGGILSALGVPELVTHSLDEYVKRALYLAGRRSELETLRQTLSQRRQGGAFFDTDRYRRDLEAAYMAMATRHSSGLRPAHITIPDPMA